MRRLLPLALFMAEPFIVSPGVHRPRNVDWKRAAALLYGDWGTSKAYVIGLAFLAAGFSSLPIILAVCAVTALVGSQLHRHLPPFSRRRRRLFGRSITGPTARGGGCPALAGRSHGDGGAQRLGGLELHHLRRGTGRLDQGAARPYRSDHGRGADSSSGWLNYFGPKHSGSLAVVLSVPTAIVVLVLIGVSAPHLTTRFSSRDTNTFGTLWVQFVGVILALSGAESIANLTGVMKLDPGSTMDHPKVSRARR